MSEFRQIFNDQGFKEGQIVASTYLTKQIMIFNVLSVGTLSAESHNIASWKESYPDIQVGDVILSLFPVDEPGRIINVPPKYHSVARFPEQKVA